MPVVTYLTPDGAQHEVQVVVGQSVMEASIRNNLPGIVADCGGNISCATCHVYIEEGEGGFAPMSEDERDMLHFTEAVTDRSRLSCQLLVSDQTTNARVTVVGI